MTTQYQRAALCATLASVNAPHVQFWSEHQHSDDTPYQKLLSKVLSYLRGELKSEANLLRFHDEFCNWREQQSEEDSLAYRILELCCAALHSACETLFDAECDDTALLLNSLAACWDEMDDLGADTQALRQYSSELQQELHSLISDSSRIPFPKTFFAFLKEADVSLFGLSND